MSMLKMSNDILAMLRQTRLRRYEHVMMKDVTKGLGGLDIDKAAVVGRGIPRLEWR